jgi:peptide/nickel transport system substrate-binding protein
MGRLDAMARKPSFWAVFLCVALVSACSSPPGAGLQQNGEAAVPLKPTVLRVGFGEQIVTFASRLPETRGRLDPVINGFLVRSDDRWQNHPYLTESIPSQSNGTWTVGNDGTMQTIWTLRSEAKWHDGEPLTAHDVVFAHKVYRDREFQATSDVPERYITGIVARDERTFEVNWDRPYFPAGDPHPRDLVPLPRHLLESLYNSGDKQAFNTSSFWNSEEYVGAGPYRVVRTVPGVSLTVTANPLHVLGRAKIDTIEFVVIPDRNSLVAQLLAGEIDFVGHAHLQAEGAAVLQEQWRDGSTIITLWEPFVMSYQQKDVPNHQTALRDVRVRRALVHAMDREGLAVQQTAGMASAAETLVAPTNVLFPRIDAAIVKYPFDPRRAAQLLSEAGWTRGADGVLRNAAAQAFDIEFITTPSTSKNGVVIADYWKQIGIESRFLNLSEAQRTDLRTRANYAGVDVAAPTDYRAYISTEMATEQNQWRGPNQSGWSDPEYDALFARLDRSLAVAERDDLTVEIERLITASVAQVRLNYVARPAAFRNNLQGVKGMNKTSTYMWNTDEWALQ